jgi:hypothetical protein
MELKYKHTFKFQTLVYILTVYRPVDGAVLYGYMDIFNVKHAQMWITKLYICPFHLKHK